MKSSYKKVFGETQPLKEFIFNANKIHSGKYNYSEVEYKNSSTKIKIICSEHGEFWMTPNNHISGRGCKKCSHLKLRNERQIPLNKFIENSNKIHNNKYDYSKVKYINCDTKIEIICPTHGSFFQNPYSHKNLKHGCHHCAWEKKGKEHQKWNHFLTDEDRIRNLDRSLVEGYIVWRKNILKRDKYTCQITGKTGKLVVHHLNSWNIIDKMKNDISNGITILEEIHILFHKEYGYGNNTKEQFEEFKQKNLCQ